jgi:hypothetical protein
VTSPIAIVPNLLDLGTAAFIEEQPSCKAVMLEGQPRVEWSFNVNRLEQWLTTIEEVLNEFPITAHRRSLEDLYFCLKAAQKQHVKEHEQVVSDAPSEEDLMAYLSAYAASVAGKA